MTNEQLALLDQAPPAKELRSRRADDGTALTYVEGRYIIETLNAIFGPSGWSREFAGQGLQIVDKSLSSDDSKLLHLVSATCEYRLYITGSPGIISEDVGFGQSGPCVNLGAAIELACKEAVTDALKRCARTIGKALGSCLYDKAWLASNRQTAAANGQTPDERWQELQDRLDGSVDQTAPTDADFSQEPPQSLPEPRQAKRSKAKKEKRRS